MVTVRGSLVRATLAAVLLLVPLTSLPEAAAEPRAASEPSATAAPVLPAEDWTPPLSTRGRWIVDADGDRFKLRSGNWHGASGTWNGSGDAEDDANHHAA